MRAFEPGTRTWVAAGSVGAVPVPPLQGALMRDAASVRWAGEDFGHLVHHRPRAVLRPNEVADVTAIVSFAGEAGLTVAARGAGHSTYGQAQAAGGIVIDMAGLSRIDDVRAEMIRVQAGALWSDVLDAALTRGATPPVLTDYLHTTVGGTLVVGGVGGTSRQHGMQVDAVVELEVVTGTGRLVTCSAQRNRRLFDAVRAGLGQCGVITSATLRLIPAPARVRYYRLYYHDLGAFLADQRRLGELGRADYLEGQFLPGEPEPGAAGQSWRYLLETAVYYTPPQHPDPTVVPAGLSAQRDEEDLSYRDFQHRMAPGEAALRVTGEWLCPHPWFAVFVPEENTADLVGAVLADLSAADLGHSGLGLLYPVRTDRLRAPQIRVPESELAWLFALLRTAGADDPTAGLAMVEANRACYDRAVAQGAIAYPINALPMSPDDWRAHFGPRWAQLKTAKKEFDPHGILNPGPGIYPRVFTPRASPLSAAGRE
ncbi:MAG TPA: FAD-binding protein [Pseudonocardiaceae bacterium]|nr:FAD-binding protein [Pseudonocardiaceae bacterium]